MKLVCLYERDEIADIVQRLATLQTVLNGASELKIATSNSIIAVVVAKLTRDE